MRNDEGAQSRSEKGRTLAAARAVARSLRRAVRLLRFPAIALLLVPVLPLAGAAALAAGAQDPGRWIVLSLLAVPAVVVVLFGVRIGRYLRAVEDTEALAREIRALVLAQDLAPAVLERFRALAERGGAGMFRRLRALWGVASLQGHLLDWMRSHPRLRWFVPPAVTATWFLILAQLWASLLSWAGFVVVLVLRIAGAI